MLEGGMINRGTLDTHVEGVGEVLLRDFPFLEARILLILIFVIIKHEIGVIDPEIGVFGVKLGGSFSEEVRDVVLVLLEISLHVELGLRA